MHPSPVTPLTPGNMNAMGLEPINPDHVRGFLPTEPTNTFRPLCSGVAHISCDPNAGLDMRRSIAAGETFAVESGDVICVGDFKIKVA